MPSTPVLCIEYCLHGAPLPFEARGDLPPCDRPVCFDTHSRRLYVMRAPQFQVAAQARAQIHLLTELERMGWPQFRVFAFAGSGGDFAEHVLRDAIKALNQRKSRLELRQIRDGVLWKLREGVLS